MKALFITRKKGNLHIYKNKKSINGALERIKREKSVQRINASKNESRRTIVTCVCIKNSIK